MSLSSFLLTKAKTQDGRTVDKELDDLFKSNSFSALPCGEVKAQKSGGATRRKRKLDDGQNSLGAGRKKAKTDTTNKNLKRKRKQTTENDDEDNEETRSERDSGRDDFATEQGSSDGGEGSDQDVPRSTGSLADEDGESFDPTKIIHESLRKPRSKSHKEGSKKKYVPQDETPAQRNLRTVFVGNLSVEVAKKRPLQKQLRRHLLSTVPTAKIESVRFRSVPFQTPTTTNLSVTSGEPQKFQTKEGREHDLARAAAWRHHKDTLEPEGKDEKKFLTPSQKKKIAFINHEFHLVADTVHAYVVFAHPVPDSPSPSTSSSVSSPLPKPHKDVMDPYEAAQIAARQCDGTLFLDRLLRVDVVGKSSAGGSAADPKSTVFVGNLDFATREEDLRVFFEGVLTEERGGPPSEPEDEEEEEEAESEKSKVRKAQTWVTRVRIVRDRETQLGKGFAYVQFVDRECVDEILALEEGKLKFAKRKLRVQRCKTIPGSSVPTKHLTAKHGKANTARSHSKSQKQSRTTTTTTTGLKRDPSAQSSASTHVVVPKGDPKLGDKLVSLSREERKKAKASDADRIARRLAKKRAKMAMVVERTKDHTSEGKKRIRVRKSTKEKDKAKTGRKKGRVRSEKSMAKLNTKK